MYNNQSMTHYINTIVDEKHMIILIDEEKGFDKIQHLSW